MTTTPSRTDLEYEILYNPKFVPLPSPQAKVKTTVVNGKPSYLMKNRQETSGPGWLANITYYDLNEVTNNIWNLVNGKRTVPEIVEEMNRQKPHVKERDILGTLLFFAENNLLVSSLEQVPKKRLTVVSPFEIDFAVIKRSNDFLQSLNKKMRPLFKRFLLWAIIAFIIVISIFFAPTIVSIYGNKANFQILGSSVVGFFFYTFVTLLPIIAIHEISHGLALAHYGGTPGEMGTGLFYFSPMFYVGTADAWGLDRNHRIMIYLAGNISTLLIGSCLVVVHLFVAIPEPGSLILTMTAFYCFTMSLFNFAPPFETDGYWVLQDAVNMPNLRQDSYSYLGSIFRRAFGLQTKSNSPTLTKRAKRILVLYAFMSLAWIMYSVYQTSIFLVYMSQDLTTSLSKIFNSILASQAVSASIVMVAFLSTVYFGMQLMGYGLIFSAAVKKARAKPLQVEAIHDRNLAVLGYLPTQVPESISQSLRARMEKTAKKLASKYQMKQIGRSWIAILKMGETRLANVQIKEHLGRIESEFRSAYQNLIISNKETLQKSIGIYAPYKVKLTDMFKRIGAESADAGNSGARAVVRAYLMKQDETLTYLLCSAFGTIWTLEVEPAEEYALEKELSSSLLLEDLALTDLYGDVENFKKRTLYGYDSLAKLTADIDSNLRECLIKPEEYQVISSFEPIRNQIIFFGRTQQIEENVEALAPLFIAQTWFGYLDDLLSMTCFALSTVNRYHIPSAKEIREMSTGELAVLSKDLQAFKENQELVHKCIENSETHLAINKQNLDQLRTSFEQSEAFKIGCLDALFRVNVENMENLPSRIKEFRKQWKLSYKRIEKVQEHVEQEYAERKPAISRRRRKMLLVYPFIFTLSIALLIISSFQPLLATWWITSLSVVLISQGLYWFIYYRTWKSSRKATKYPSHAFDTSHNFILALTEAIHGYVITEDVLTPL